MINANDLVCSCGAMMFSDGQVWSCPWMTTVGHHSMPMRDKRCHRSIKLNLKPKVGPPGLPGSKFQGRTRLRLHAGPQAACVVCSPETAPFVLAQLERLKKREEGRRSK
jgi:hypothetical protein